MRRRLWLLAGLLAWACNDNSFSGSNGRAENPPPPPPPPPVAAPTSGPQAAPAVAANPRTSTTTSTTDLGRTSAAASTATATAAAPATPGAPVTLDVSCSSSQYQPCQTTQDCAQFTVPAGAAIMAVTLKQQVSVATCEQGGSWSYDDTSLACWAGCRGTFTVTYVPGAAPATPSP